MVIEEKYQNWIIRQNERGKHVSSIPIQASTNERLVVKDMMVMGLNQNELCDNAHELVCGGIPDRQRSLEYSIDFFNGLLHKFVVYKEECAKLYVKLRSLATSGEYTDFNCDMLNSMKWPKKHYNVTEDEIDAALNGYPINRTRKMIAHHQLVLQVVAEIMPEQNTERGTHRTRMWAAVVGDESTTDFRWDEILKMMRDDNVNRINGIIDDGNNTSEKRRKLNSGECSWLCLSTLIGDAGFRTKEKKKSHDELSELEMAMLVKSDRPLRTDDYVDGMRQWLVVAKGYINQSDCAEIRRWECTESRTNTLRQVRLDMDDPELGPWEQDVAKPDTIYEHTRVSDIFSFSNELSMRPSKQITQIPPKFEEQLDDSLYLRTLFCNHDEALPDACTMHSMLQTKCVNAMHPEITNGVTFEFLPDEVRNECIFEINNSHFRTPRHHLKKCSFGYYYSHVDKYQQTNRLTVGNQMVPTVCKIPSAFVADVAMDCPLLISENPELNAINKPAQHTTKLSKMHTPLHDIQSKTDMQRCNHDRILAALRSGAACADEYVPMSKVYQTQARSLLYTLDNDEQICNATKAMCRYLTSRKTGYIGSVDILKRYIRQRSKAPDMEPADLALQERFLMYEYLDISTVHSAMYLMHSAGLDSQDPHTKLFINGCFYGFGETGKGTAIEKLRKHCFVDGTIIISGYQSALADLENGPALMHCMFVQDEALDNIVATDKGKAAEVGNKALSIEKRKHTENIIDSKTLTHVQGIKTVVHIERPYRCATCYISNLDHIDRLSQAFLTRLLPRQVAMLTRPDKGAADKNAWSAMGERGSCKDEMRNNIGGYCKQLQCTIFLFATMREFAGMQGPDMTVFALLTKQISEAMKPMGISLHPREIEKAQLLAKVRVYEGVFFREFQTPHGRHSGYSDVSIETLIDSAHSWEMDMVCSEAIARGALRSMLNSFRQGTMCKVAKVLMSLVQQKNHKYSKMFVVPNANREATFNEGKCIVDLDHVRFTVAKEASGLRTFCTTISNALSDTIGNTLTPAQIEDVLNDIARLGEIEHHELDMLLNQQHSRESLEPWELYIQYTVKGWKERNNNALCIFNPEWLDATKELWEEHKFKSTACWPSETWPSETSAGSKKSSRVLVLDDWRFTGQIKISTAFLNQASKDGFVNEFDRRLEDALCTTFTTERAIAREPTDMMEIDPTLPYLCFTERAKWGPAHVSVVNQNFVPSEHYSNVMNHDRSSFRSREVVYFQRKVPIDTQVTVLRAEQLSEKHPLVIPSAHQILKSDPSGVCSRFGPHVLDELMTKDSEYKLLCETNQFNGEHIAVGAQFSIRKLIVCRYLKSEYMDLMRHQLHGVNLQQSPAAELACNEFCLKISHLVAELSYAARIGDLRQKSLVNDSQKKLTVEISAAKKLLAKAHATKSGIEDEPEDINNPSYNEVLSRLRYCDEEDIKEHIKELHRKSQKLNTERRSAMKDSGCNKDMNSFIEEWRTLCKPGVHSGPGYVRYLRREGTRLLQIRDNRDGEWMQIHNVQS